ncbi:MAG: DnaB-like helicase C-terminal domain-containing protein [Lysobacteraceae bacterium]
MTDSQYLHKEACPECGSQDNLARYDDGHGYCFGCGYREPAKGETGKSGSSGAAADDPKPRRNKDLLATGDFVRLPSRGLEEPVMRRYGYHVTQMSGGRMVQVADYRRDGVVVAQKVRGKNKQFTFLGEPKKAGFFGQHIQARGRRLFVTEGEIDALSLAQCLDLKWPVVSVPNGAQGASKTVRQEIEFLEQFDEVVFCFDMDEPGIAAATECATLLTPGKAYIAELPAKDANEALVEGKKEELIRAVWNARPYRPDGVVSADSIMEDAKKPPKRGLSWPWSDLDALTFGIRTKEVYTLGAGTGVGKTTVVKQVIEHLVRKHKQSCGLVFLEEPPATTLRGLAGLTVGKATNLPDVVVTPEEIEKGLKPYMGKLHLYDHFGAMTWETIKEKLRYMVVGLGVKWLFVDHLTALAANEDDDKKALDRIMADLASLAQELDVGIFVISHLATPDGKSHEEGGRVTIRHFRGSRAIGFWSHFMLGLERDQQHEDHAVRNTTVVRVLKDRFTGMSVGLCIGLRYNPETLRMEQVPVPNFDKKSAKSHGFEPASDNEDF